MAHGKVLAPSAPYGGEECLIERACVKGRRLKVLRKLWTLPNWWYLESTLLISFWGGGCWDDVHCPFQTYTYYSFVLSRKGKILRRNRSVYGKDRKAEFTKDVRWWCGWCSSSGECDCNQWRGDNAERPTDCPLCHAAATTSCSLLPLLLHTTTTA